MKKLNNANSRIINYAIFISMLFSIPAIIGMYIRSINIGLESLFYYQLFLFTFLIALFVSRKKTSFIFRTVSYFILVLAAMSPYMYKIGALGYWIVDFFIIVLLISVFAKIKYAYITLVLITILIVLLAFLYTNGFLQHNFEIRNYINSYNIWLGMIVTFIYVAILIISIISMQRSFFLSSIKDSIVAKEEALKNEQKFRNIFNSSNDGILI